MNRSVYLIILNWNGWQDTAECIESCKILEGNNLHIVIVDNGSTDQSEYELRRRFPEMAILQTGLNLGYAGGNNVGIRYALEKGADYIWLLNNDTVVDTDALVELISIAEISPDVGVVGSKILLYMKRNYIWFAGGFWKGNKLFPSHRGEGERDMGQYDSVSEVDYISGCSLLFRSDVVSEVGYLDEGYFLYWEDTDWCARILNAGWKVMYAPKSRVYHKVSASSKTLAGKQIRYFVRNAFWFYLEHQPRHIWRILLTILYVIPKFYFTGQRELAKNYVFGLFDFIGRRRGQIE